MEFTGIFLPIRKGHPTDIALILIPFLFVIFVQKLRGKPLNHYAGDLVVASLLLSALAVFTFGFFL